MEYIDINFNVANEALAKQTKDMHSLVARRVEWLDTATQDEYRIQGGVQFISQCMNIAEKLKKLEHRIYKGFAKANALSTKIEKDLLGKTCEANIYKLIKIIGQNEEKMNNLNLILRTLENEVGITSPSFNNEEHE